MSQWSHSHGKGKPRCYDSLCGLSQKERDKTTNLTANIFLTLLLNGVFFIALLGGISYIFFVLWAFLLIIIINLTIKSEKEDKIIAGIFQVLTFLIHLLIIYLML